MSLPIWASGAIAGLPTFDAAQTMHTPGKTIAIKPTQFSGLHKMFQSSTPTPHHPHTDVPDEYEPGAPPVEPDEGPVPSQVPDDPEHDRVINLGVRAPLSPAGLALPHERDESTNTIATTPDPKMVQAKRDIDAGMVDTDMHATPGLDAAQRERLVPGPGGKRPTHGI